MAIGGLSPDGRNGRNTAPQSRGRWIALFLGLLIVAGACTSTTLGSSGTKGKLGSKSGHSAGSAADLMGIHKIRHIVVIMQENRSFDSYFGTYPGADGIPFKDGVPTVCAPDARAKRCIRPFHDPNDRNSGGPHTAFDALHDINGGKMNGFIQSVLDVQGRQCVLEPQDPRCVGPSAGVDVMGYHDQREIPNYWAYARHFVLQDHMFEPNYGWSLPAHLFMVSAWSARCRHPSQPMTCVSDLERPDNPETAGPAYGWTDLTYLLHKDHVSWGYYLDQGTQPDCDDGAMTCRSERQTVGTPEIWNPLPDFVDVHRDRQIGNIQDASKFFQAAHEGTLPAVSWVVPNNLDSEHPSNLVTTGQAWVTRLIDSVMRGPDWKSSAIFVSWDDWGGFYDHVVPPQADGNGYGLRVPGLVISPYARQGFVDHQVLSFDAYLKFIEDDFLSGARLDPGTDGRPDSRPQVREDSSILGNLIKDFDFSQDPRGPMILPLHPANVPL